MTDLKPPRVFAGEHETLMALLQYQRESFVRKMEGVGDAAGQSPVPSGTTLLWLAQHLAQAEQLWVMHRFAGLPLAAGGPPETLAAAVVAYRDAWARVDAVIGIADFDDPCVDPDSGVNLRWVVMHLLEETARHAGHADILRELLDGQTGR
ncbi:MAG: DinB family protein [Ilumatobacteraceae bacterium]